MRRGHEVGARQRRCGDDDETKWEPIEDKAGEGRRSKERCGVKLQSGYLENPVRGKQNPVLLLHPLGVYFCWFELLIV